MLATAGRPALAAAGHTGALPPLTLHAAFTEWQFAPVVTGGVAVVAVLYAWGVIRVARRHPARPWPLLSTVSFALGLLTVVLAVESSIGAYDDVLFWVHMVQHVLLIMVAPLFLILGRPVTLLLHASHNPLHTWVKRVVRSRPVTWLTNPVVGFGLYAGTVVGTHLTGFMNLTLTHPAVHDTEHVVYLVVGVLFFLPLIGREPIRWRLSAPVRLFVIALAMPVDTFTGVVLGETNHEPFPAYAAVHRTWGPSLLADLHAGGAVMWIGGDGIMALLFVLAFAAWARDRGGEAPGSGGDWIEEVRARELAARTGLTATGRAARDADSDEQLAAYNAYLARLARGEPGGGPE